MLYSDSIRMAMSLAYKAHEGAVDKAGMFYIYHPFHVAESVGNDENAIIVALLHDVIEDTNYTLEDLRGMGFNEECLEAIRLLTHTKGTDYFEYVNRIKDNSLARKVKIADLLHNSDISRLPNPTEKDFKRVENKYKKALKILGYG